MLTYINNTISRPRAHARRTDEADIGLNLILISRIAMPISEPDNVDTMPSHPEPYKIQPKSAHKTTLIILHGTSQNGPSFAEPFLSYPFPFPTHQTQSTTLPAFFPSTKFVFPTGALKPTTVFGGKETNAWFDIHDFSDRTVGENDQIPGLKESIEYLSNLIETEKELVGKENVALMGFSQGCALGVTMLLSGELEGIGGFVGMSGWLPFRVQIEDLMLQYPTKEKRQKVRQYVRSLLGFEPMGLQARELGAPIWLGHGGEDLKVKTTWGTSMSDVLSALGMDAKFNVYDELGHWWCEEELKDLAAFLQSKWGE